MECLQPETVLAVFSISHKGNNIFFWGFKMDKRPYLLHVIKGRKRRVPDCRIGVIVAVGPGQIGWSKVNKTATEEHDPDQFDLNYGIQVALTRAANPEAIPGDVPEQFQKYLDIMAKDSMEYFSKKGKATAK